MSTFVNNNIFQGATTTGTLGSATGRTLFTNGPLPGNISSIQIVITTTATVGNRLFIFQIKDSSGNQIWRASANGNTVASTAQQFGAGAGVPAQNTGGALETTLPNFSYLPPNGTVVILDGANIDPNDSVTVGQIVVQY